MECDLRPIVCEPRRRGPQNLWPGPLYGVWACPRLFPATSECMLCRNNSTIFALVSGRRPGMNPMCGTIRFRMLAFIVGVRTHDTARAASGRGAGRTALTFPVMRVVEVSGHRSDRRRAGPAAVRWQAAGAVTRWCAGPPGADRTTHRLTTGRTPWRQKGARIATALPVRALDHLSGAGVEGGRGANTLTPHRPTPVHPGCRWRRGPSARARACADRTRPGVPSPACPLRPPLPGDTGVHDRRGPHHGTGHRQIRVYRPAAGGRGQPGTSMRWVPITDSSRSALSAGEPGSAV